MRKSLLVFFSLLVITVPSFGRVATFNIKELITLRDHNMDFFNGYVTKKGYTYERSKYDEKHGRYAFVLLTDIRRSFHEIEYITKASGTQIAFNTSSASDYVSFKKQLDMLEFKVISSQPEQKDGRPMQMTEYSDGHTTIRLYNSYIENNYHRLVCYYIIKVIQP